MALPGNRLVIGLDYGTTFTGVAYQAVTANLGHERDDPVKLVQDWPGGVTSIKVPSEISYSPATSGASQWGGDFAPGSLKLVWTKLDLDRQERSEELNMILNALVGTNNLDFDLIQQSQGLPSYPAKDPVDIVADYLEKVRERLWHHLSQTYPPAVLEATRIDLVFTVPAIWSDAAKNRTFRAISKAGFNKIYFTGLRNVIMVSEPEATCLSLLKTLQPSLGEHGIRPGNSFLVCDAGGGTVDLISYQVKQIVPTIEIEEMTLGTGDKCGATFIDRNFRQWFEKKLGTPAFQTLTEKSPFHGIGSHTIVEPLMLNIMREFETIKQRFAGIGRIGDEFITLPNPLNEYTDSDNGIVEGEVRITEQDLKEMFYFSVSRTIELIAGQIAEVEIKGSKIRYVFLSGGFARSEYLYNEVEEFLRLRGIKLLRPENVWSSVVRGAVAWGVEAEHRNVTYVHQSPKHYGLATSQPFSSFEHSEADAYYDTFDGQKKARDQVVWLIKKGDAIFSTAPKHASIRLCRKFGRNDPRVFKTLLVSSDHDQAAQRLVDVPEASRTDIPITYDFTNIPEKDLTRPRPGRRRSSYFMVYFEIEIHLGEDRNIEVRVTCNGKQMKKITTQL